MILILRRIHKHTDKQDIIDFLTPALKGHVFRKTGKIEFINIIVLKDTQRKTLEYHALITVNSDKAGKRAIKTLNRTSFNNRNIIVREYFYRSWHNDPRTNMHQWNEELLDKRKRNRRRSKLEIITDDAFNDSQPGTIYRQL